MTTQLLTEIRTFRAALADHMLSAEVDESRVDNGAITLTVRCANEETFEALAKKFTLPNADHMHIEMYDEADGIRAEVVYLID